MPNKYEQLDALIQGAITHKPKRFGAIFVGQVAAECGRLAAMGIGKEPFRVLDRRLQALRKAGKIQSTTKGWVLVEHGQ
ncbi:hypothetical protein C3408_22640 [Candidatus Pantoea alvi]|nr:hypothetical protein C3408_22640 [Pantoea alvi]